PLRRGAGHRGGTAVLQGRARRPPGLGRARDRADPRRPGGRPRPAATAAPVIAVRFVLATANPDKAEEIAAILTDVELVSRPPHVPEVEESGATLTDNAVLKAQALVAATGQAAIADDTGLEVEALGGAPGVRSARYAGEH